MIPEGSKSRKIEFIRRKMDNGNEKDSDLFLPKSKEKLYRLVFALKFEQIQVKGSFQRAQATIKRITNTCFSATWI